jgi:4-aminobutyrate aminotransferase
VNDPALLERHRGLMIGIELVEARTGAASPHAAVPAIEAARSRGLLIGKGGLCGNFLRLTPPMSVSRQQAEDALAVLGDALGAVACQL